MNVQPASFVNYKVNKAVKKTNISRRDWSKFYPRTRDPRVYLSSIKMIGRVNKTSGGQAPASLSFANSSIHLLGFVLPFHEESHYRVIVVIVRFLFHGGVWLFAKISANRVTTGNERLSARMERVSAKMNRGVSRIEVVSQNEWRGWGEDCAKVDHLLPPRDKGYTVARTNFTLWLLLFALRLPANGERVASAGCQKKRWNSIWRPAPTTDYGTSILFNRIIPRARQIGLRPSEMVALFVRSQPLSPLPSPLFWGRKNGRQFYCQRVTSSFRYCVVGPQFRYCVGPRCATSSSRVINGAAFREPCSQPSLFVRARRNYVRLVKY